MEVLGQGHSNLLQHLVQAKKRGDGISPFVERPAGTDVRSSMILQRRLARP